MTILKSTKDVLISTDYQIVNKQALSPQAIIELQQEYKWYTYYKSLQGVILPQIYDMTGNTITMQYCPGTHFTIHNDIIQIRQQLHSLPHITTYIDRDEWKWLVQIDLIQTIQQIIPGESLSQLIDAVQDILTTQPSISAIYCHGDFQPQNILHHNETTIILDPKPLWMNPLYDLMYYCIMMPNIHRSIIKPYCIDRSASDIMLSIATLRKIHVYTHAGEYHKVGPLLDRYTHMQKALNM